ncbi:MAG: Pr6Pr family membrane protein [Atopobiaceae bacterium]|nr:Pr6Pr family membrane protein [Atopobiaceae bacterium]
MDAKVVASFVINVAIVVFTAYSWLRLMFGKASSKERLTARGLRSLRYFTVLSNLLSGAVSLACIIAYAVGGPSLPAWALAIRLVAASEVMLTCIVVILLLVPVYGVGPMYRGGNLWMHLVLPLLAALDCCALVPVGTLPWYATFLAAVPEALYATYYLQGILRHGAEEDGVVYDFYHFLRWGTDKIPLICAASIVSTWVIALGLYGLNLLVCG